jgi:hypothetical protein
MGGFTCGGFREARPEAAPSRVTKGAVSFEVALVPPRVRAGRTTEASLRLRVEAGAFVIAHRLAAAGRETRDLAPFSLAFPGAPFRVGTPRYPEGASATPPGSAAPVLAYHGDATVVAPVFVGPEAIEGERRLRVRVVFQACDARRCQAPESVVLEAPFVILRP